MSNEYFEAADRVNELINDSENDNVTVALRRGHAKLVNLARSKSIIKIASNQSGEHVSVSEIKEVV